MKKLIKQDIGFLEYPLWFQDCQVAERTNEGFVWQDLDGFTYRAGYKPPVKVDLIILLYILLRSQQDDWKEELEFSRFEILKACGMATGKREYERLNDSLKRWKMVGVEFQGTFYDGKTYRFMNFGIIDGWELEENSKRLRVTVSSQWLEKIKDSNYCKMIDFEQIKSLRSPLTTRLYELLIKTFQTRPHWSCGARKLAAKIPMKEQYPADIIPKIKTAVSRINEKTELQIKLTVRRPKRGKAIFDFEKLVETGKLEESGESEFEILDMPEEKREGFVALCEMLPKKHRHKKTIREAVSRFLRKKGDGYVRRNILYANKSAKDNYRAFLLKALREDWGAGFQEDLEEAKDHRRTQEAKAETKRGAQVNEKRIREEAQELLEAMSPGEKAQLKKEAKATFSIEQLNSPLADTFVTLQMRAILEARLRSHEEG